MSLNREQLCALIPHAGDMCLLAGVESWNDQTITCIATGHRDPHNPLRRDGRLPSVCGIEYGAQAMAVHGGLLAAGAAPRVGFLASVREVSIQVPDLDHCGELLHVTATCLINNENNQMYEFSLRDGERVVMSGRAAVFLQNEEPTS